MENKIWIYATTSFAGGRQGFLIISQWGFEQNSDIGPLLNRRMCRYAFTDGEGALSSVVRTNCTLDEDVVSDAGLLDRELDGGRGDIAALFMQQLGEHQGLQAIPIEVVGRNEEYLVQLIAGGGIPDSVMEILDQDNCPAVTDLLFRLRQQRTRGRISSECLLDGADPTEGQSEAPRP